ncbi:MAG: hypothetical protein QM778_26875 [Myxococcales bacterium]
MRSKPSAALSAALVTLSFVSQACLPAPEPAAYEECVKDQLHKGIPLLEAQHFCRAHEPPPRPDPSNCFTGDAVIDDASDVATFAPFSEIHGALRVLSGAPNVVSLPNLTRVTGDVELVYSSYRPEPPPMSASYPAMRCGAIRQVTADVRVFQLPQLTTIGGDLTMEQENSFSGISTQPIELGMDQLTSLGGSLSISIGQFGGSPCGLTGLGQIPADLTVRFLTSGEVDGSISGLLTTLTQVGGTFTFERSHNSFGVPLPLLARVGALRILKDDPSLSGFHFPSLTDVAGLAELSGTGPLSNLTALTRVGSLLVHDSGYLSLEDVGGASLELGGLELRDNPALAALTTPAGTSKVTLAVSAPLTIVDNPLLSAAAICAFVDYEEGQSWSGPSDLGGTVCP